MAYITAGLLNYRALRKYADIELDMKSIFVRPLIASLVMGAATIAAYKLVYLATSSNTLSTLISIIIAVIVYFVTVFRTGAVNREEIELIPKGELIYRIAVKMKIAK